MRICLLYPHIFGHDGYVRDINALYVELSRSRKHQLSICPPAPDIAINGRPGLDEIKLIKPLIAALREVDAVHVFGFFFPLYRLLTTLIRLAGKPYILSPLAQLEPLALQVSHFKKSMFIHAFGKGMLNNAAMIHAFSASEAASIKTFTKTVPVVEASLGTYLEDIPPKIRPSRLRPANDYFLFFGRLSYFHKGIDVLLDGYASYLANGGGAALVIAGKSWQGSHERIRSRLVELNIAPNVRFLGEVSADEKYALMKECKAFVYPTRFDGPPRPIREALALQKPLLISHQANIASDLESHGWGYAFNPSPEELASAMQRMETQYTSQNYQNPSSLFSWKAVADQYTAMYDMLATYQHVEAMA